MSKNIVLFEGPVVLRLAWRIVTEEKTHFLDIDANTVQIGEVLRVPNEFSYHDEVINEQRTISVILTHTRHLRLCSFCTTVFCLHALDMESHIKLCHSDDAFFREHHQFMQGLRTVNAMNGRCVALKNWVRMFITECVKIADVDCNSALPRSQRKTRSSFMIQTIPTIYEGPRRTSASVKVVSVNFTVLSDAEVARSERIAAVLTSMIGNDWHL